MQKRDKIFTVSYVIITLLAACCLTFSLITTDPKTTAPAEPPPQFSGYTVKEYDGKIAVFESGGSEPLRVIDGLYVRDLPTYDRRLLEAGINVDTEAELNRLLEDYDG